MTASGRVDSAISTQQARRYTLYGAGIGLLFPVGATLLRVALLRQPWTLVSLAAVQAADPMLWIIDSAPLVLGLFARLAGYRQDRLMQLNRNLSRRESEIEAARMELELRVKERTTDIDEARRQMALRARRLQIVAELSQVLSQLRDPDKLIAAIAALVSARFELYHVGLFLVDEDGRFATLRAASSPGGPEMLARGHRVTVGLGGIVGFVARSGTPRVAPDVAADPLYLKNPELPDTKAELALPLKVGDRITGVLDVQSDQRNAFGPEEIDVFSVLANQMAIAIENSRLFEHSRAAVDSIYRLSSLELQRIAGEGGAVAYAYLPEGKVVQLQVVEPLAGMPSGASPAENDPRVSHPGRSFPVRVRDRVIGHISLEPQDSDRRWTQNEIALIESIAERAASALENAGLLSESQRRASKERTISEISTRLGASTRLDSILQTAARELSRALGGSDVLVQIEPAALDLAATTEA